MITHAFVALFIAAMATSLGVSVIIPILPLYAKGMGASGAVIGLIFSSFAISKSLVSPFVGRLADRKGKKLLIVGGLILFFIVALMFIWSRNPVDLIVTRVLMGVANAMVVPIVGAYVGELAKKDKEASYMAVFNISILIGIGIGPLVGGFLTDWMGTDSAFFLMAISTLVALCTILIFLPREDRNSGNPSISKNPIKQLLSIHSLRGLILYQFINTISLGGIMVFLPILTKNNNITTTQIGILVSVILCFSGLLQVPFGRLADSTDDKSRLVVLGALISVTALLALPSATNFWLFLITGVVYAIGGAMAGPAASALIIRNSRDIGLGFSIATFDSIQAMGFIIGPILSGIVMDFMGIDAIFYLSAGIYFLGIMVFHYHRSAPDKC